MEKVKKSSVKKKTLNPMWNEEFLIPIRKSNMAVVIDLFDENRVTRDDFLGRAILRLAQVELEQDGWQTWKTFPLQGRTERSRVSGQPNCISVFFFISDCLTIHLTISFFNNFCF